MTTLNARIEDAEKTLNNKALSPLLSVGTYGVHLTKNPAGTFSFTGSVPNTCTGCYKTFKEGIIDFVKFFKSQPMDFQRENIGNLRNDIFAIVMES